MVTNTTIYTRQIYCCLNTDSLNVEFRNGDEVILMDQNVRMIFDEDNQTFHRIPMGGGGGGNLITKTITANGIYAASSDNADGYSEVTVNVQGSGGDPYEVARSILNNTITEYIDPEITTIKNGAFQYCTTLTTLKVHNLTQVGAQAFQGTTSLGNVAFPQLTTFSPGNGQYFLASTSAPVIDFGRYPGNGIGDYIMENATTTTLVLRSTVVVPLRHIASLPKPFQNNETGGTLYVPSTLISSYQAATNWSTVLGYTNNQIKAIEGSIYETQYADGTPVGS